MIRYYCSGFDISNAFGHGLGYMFKGELKDTKSIVYIPGGFDKMEKVKTKYIPAFINHFKSVGIEFENVNIITPDLTSYEAKRMIQEASFIMLMGGDPFKQKEMYEKLNIIDDLKKFDGIMMGFSAGAMLMSKYIIITPCSLEYPEFRIENGLDFDNLSIYPHNNTSNIEYPDVLSVGEETYKKQDLIKVANEYGSFYLLQDNLREDGLTDVSIIKSKDGVIEYYYEFDGKIWVVNHDIELLDKKINKVVI